MDEDRTKRPGYGRYGEWEWDDDHPLVHSHDLTNADFVDPLPPSDDPRDADLPPRPTDRDDRPLYDGRPVRDPYARRGGYRRAPDEAWAAAKNDYLAGDAVSLVCARHGLSRSSLYARGRAEGWLEQERGAPEPVDLDAEIEAGLPNYGDMARHALVRLNRAIEAGRGAEAAVWMRLHTKLLTLAQTTNPPPLGEVSAQPTEGALSASQSPVASPPPKPKPAPKPLDSLDIAMAQARALETIVRSADDLLTLGEPGRRLIEKGLEAVDLMASLSPPISDISDVSDTVFPSGADQPETAPQGPP